MSRAAHLYACYYYNKGLEKAKIKDVSGAITMLNRAVSLDKKYVEARNLLGLCYFQVGEVGEAMIQWVLVNYYDPNNVKANYFLGIANKNQARLDRYRDSIKKFNQGLRMARAGATDQALIQLKRAASMNTDYVAAWQLLAVLYMKSGDYTRARKALKRTLKNDIANPKSLRLLAEIRDIRRVAADLTISVPDDKAKEAEAKEILRGKSKAEVRPHFNFEESGPDYRVFLSLVAGILIGIICVYFLIVPGVRQEYDQEALNKESSSSAEMAQYLSEIDTLQKENSSLQSKLEIEEQETDSYKQEAEMASAEKYYTNIIDAYVYFQQLQSGNAGSLEMFLLRQKLEAVTTTELDNASAKSLYDQVLAVYPDVMSSQVSADTLLNEAKTYYENSDYATANSYLAYAYEQSPDNEEVLYLLARTFQLTGDNTKAKSYYNDYLSKYPDGEWKNTVNTWLAEIG
ncbi:MAG: tetratricopeptide repeat protein [Lachnospiraceae bacterium]|nr:tetratricopeptide repeat protein [Lachnospiraceae bacterium]